MGIKDVGVLNDKAGDPTELLGTAESSRKIGLRDRRRYRRLLRCIAQCVRSERVLIHVRYRNVDAPALLEIPQRLSDLPFPFRRRSDSRNFDRTGATPCDQNRLRGTGADPMQTVMNVQLKW